MTHTSTPAFYEEQIRLVLVGERVTTPRMTLSPDLASLLLEKHGVEVDDFIEKMETNGWSQDWWVRFAHSGKRFIVSGSMFSGQCVVEWTGP